MANNLWNRRFVRKRSLPHFFSLTLSSVLCVWSNKSRVLENRLSKILKRGTQCEMFSLFPSFLSFFRSFNMKCDCRRKTEWRRIYMQVSGCSFIAEDRKPLSKSLNPEESVRKATFAKRNTGFQSFRNAILPMQ